jgi:hypothetical protein
MYLYYIDVTPVTGKNMLSLKHSAILHILRFHFNVSDFWPIYGFQIPNFTIPFQWFRLSVEYARRIFSHQLLEIGNGKVPVDLTSGRISLPHNFCNLVMSNRATATRGRVRLVHYKMSKNLVIIRNVRVTNPELLTIYSERFLLILLIVCK